MWQDFIPIALAVGIPAVGAALAIVRYFWKKEKCFIAMKNKIDELSKHDGDSLKTHNEYDLEIRDIQDKQQEMSIYVKLILKKLDIPYDS